MSIVLAVTAVVFVGAAFLFSPIEHEFARARIAGAWKVWSDLWPSSAEASTGAKSGEDDRGASFEERTEMGLLFITGRRSIAGMDYRWCYLRRDGGDHDADRSLQVGQGVIIGGSPLMTWNEFTNEQTAIFELAPSALSAAAKRGCVLE
jgi:hypothetical protein